MPEPKKPEPVGSRMPGELRDIVKKMSDADEPDENIGTVINKYMDDHDTMLGQTLSEFKGVAKGVPEGVWSTVRGVLYDMPVGLYGDIKNAIAGQPPEYAKSVLDSITNMPESFKNGTHEERGKMMGNVLGGFLAAKYAPGTPRTVAKGVGTSMEFTGTKAGWPLRMVGSHALGEGNLLGGAMIAAPEVLQSTGKALREWGENTKNKFAPGTVRLVNPVTDEVVATNPATMKAKTPGAIRIGTPSAKVQAGFRQDVGSEINKALDFDPLVKRARENLKGIDTAIAKEETRGNAVRVASAQREADLKATDTIEKAKAGMTPAPPKVTETVKAPGQTMSTTFSEGGGLTPIEQELLKRATSVKPAGSNRSIDQLAPKTEPVRSSPGLPTISGSKSTKAQSAVPGMSNEDIVAMQDIVTKNPGISAEEAAAEVLRQRAQRSQMYRSDARLSKFEQSALDRDTE
jgi:hypothetical protein